MNSDGGLGLIMAINAMAPAHPRFPGRSRRSPEYLGAFKNRCKYNKMKKRRLKKKRGKQ